MVAFFNVSRFALSSVLECHGLQRFVYVIPNGGITYDGMQWRTQEFFRWGGFNKFS